MNRPPLIVIITLNPAIDMTVGLRRLKRGRINIGSSVAQQAGGKGVNIATYLTDRQVPVIATGLLGDTNVELLKTLFACKDVVDSLCHVPDIDRTNIKISDRIDRQATDINPPGIDATPADLGALCDRIDTLADTAGAVLCGNLVGGSPPDTYMRLLTRLSRHGVPTLADTSDAPLAQVLAAPRDELPMAIKPSRHELELWADTSLPTLAKTVDVARAVHARGVAQIIMSLGEEDALLVTTDGTWQASLPPVYIASTVGAGDAMVAGVLVGWRASVGAEETVCLSVVLTVCKLQRLGPHLPAPGEVCERAAAIQMQYAAWSPDHHIAPPHAQHIQGADYGKPAGGSRCGWPHHPRDARRRGPAPCGTRIRLQARRRRVRPRHRLGRRYGDAGYR